MLFSVGTGDRGTGFLQDVLDGEVSGAMGGQGGEPEEGPGGTGLEPGQSVFDALLQDAEEGPMKKRVKPQVEIPREARPPQEVESGDEEARRNWLLSRSVGYPKPVPAYNIQDLMKVRARVC